MTIVEQGGRISRARQAIAGRLTSLGGNPRIAIILVVLWGIAWFILFAFTAFFVELYFDHKLEIYLSLIVELAAAVVGIWLLFGQAISANHRFVQTVILMITIASFYAFGWPRKLAPDELVRAFSELAVIAVLFLLAELAAFLTLASDEITSRLRDLGDKVVNTVDPINTALTTLIDRLETNKIREAVDTLASLMKLSAAVGAFPDAEATVLSGIASYARLWAEFLHSAANPRVPETERRLKFCLSFFQTYMAAELRDLGEEKQSEAGRRHAVGITTVDGVYLEILRHLLSVESEVIKPTGAKEQLFVWVITNALPDSFYHWGQDGHRGSYPIMDDFRRAVRKFIDSGHEYYRLFLLSSHLDHAPDRDKIGIDLKKARAVEELNHKVLLLIGEDKDEPIEFAQTQMFWSKLETFCHHDDASKAFHLLEEVTKGGHIDLQSERTFYGIVEQATAEALIGPVGQSRKIAKRNLDDTMGDYYIRPVGLLNHFAKYYHSEEAPSHDRHMFFMRVDSRADLQPLPARYSDCMIVGTKDGSQYRPIIAVSTDLALNSNTMKMEVFTSQEQLSHCMTFWNDARSANKIKTLTQFLGDLNPPEPEVLKK